MLKCNLCISMSYTQIQVDQKVAVNLMKKSVYSNNPHKIDELKMAITEYIRSVDGVIPNTVFENTVRCVKVWRLAGYTLNITCNFLYCNHQVHPVEVFQCNFPCNIKYIQEMVVSNCRRCSNQVPSQYQPHITVFNMLLLYPFGALRKPTTSFISAIIHCKI
jgi:hypothetical protein